MAHEVETKVLGIDTAALKGKLSVAGAKETASTMLRVDWYRPQGIKEGEDPWFLRIRTDAEGRHEVTWKAKSEILGTARRHKEINFMIDEPEKLADLFAELGLERYAHQEKKRTSYTLAKWRFEIDEYPHMPPFLEIEGTSNEHVEEAIALLGLQAHTPWARGERILIQERYHLDWYDMRF